MADPEIEQLDSTTVRITESVLKVTEYDIPALQKKRARLVAWNDQAVAGRNAEIAEIDRILNLIS
jgi:hypothetical protein